MLKLMGKKYLQFYKENFCLSKPVGLYEMIPVDDDASFSSHGKYILDI